MLAGLLSFSDDLDPATGEDIVQESFSAALNDWRINGTPSNPAGWIYTVCRNKAINYIKKTKTNTIAAWSEHNSYEDAIPESPVEDQQLKMLFTCANPDLPPKSQVVITLKYLANLKVEAIARLLGMTVDGVDKILVRARQKIKSQNLLRETTDSSALKSRLPTVHKVIYLIFNEGYRSSWGKEMIREELCEEALILNHSLLKSSLPNKETLALHALMLFNSARIKSRFDSDGEIVELEKQDRSLWNADLIALATGFLNRAKDEVISTYHIEASIAYLHCAASSFELTDWPLIVGLYEQLLHDNPNPFVEMNYAIALFFAGKTKHSFEILNQLKQHTFLHEHFLLTATLGKLHLLKGDRDRAKEFLLCAYEQTSFAVEKNLIKRLINAG